LLTLDGGQVTRCLVEAITCACQQIVDAHQRPEIL
jgi:hypothetical protein